jgi:hypothetical protein
LEPERFLSLGRVVLGNGRVLISDLEAHLERVSPHDRSAKALGIAYLLKLRTDRDEIVSACKFEDIYTIEQIRKYNGYIRKLGADRHLSRPRGNSSTDVLQ